jgi:hypothetical protein
MHFFKGAYSSAASTRILDSLSIKKYRGTSKRMKRGTEKNNQFVTPCDGITRFR